MFLTSNDMTQIKKPRSLTLSSGVIEAVASGISCELYMVVDGGTNFSLTFWIPEDPRSAPLKRRTNYVVGQGATDQSSL